MEMRAGSTSTSSVSPEVIDEESYVARSSLGTRTFSFEAFSSCTSLSYTCLHARACTHVTTLVPIQLKSARHGADNCLHWQFKCAALFRAVPAQYGTCLHFKGRLSGVKHG